MIENATGTVNGAANGIVTETVTESVTEIVICCEVLRQSPPLLGRQDGTRSRHLRSNRERE